MNRLLPSEIHTERLVLRPWADEDVPALTELRFRNHDRLVLWMPGAETLLAESEVREWIHAAMELFDHGRHFVYGVFLHQYPIGEVGLHPPHPGSADTHPTLSYWVDKDSEGYGYATEAAKAVVQAALDLGFPQVVVEIDTRNHRSLRLAERLGLPLKVEADPVSSDRPPGCRDFSG